MNNKELVEYLNSLNIKQTSDWTEDISEKVWNEHFQNYTPVARNQDVDTHRWYETSVEVLKMNDGFIGVRSITNVYSENSNIEDCCHQLEFYEMEEVPSIYYKIKK